MVAWKRNKQQLATYLIQQCRISAFDIVRSDGELYHFQSNQFYLRSGNHAPSLDELQSILRQHKILQTEHEIKLNQPLLDADNNAMESKSDHDDDESNNNTNDSTLIPAPATVLDPNMVYDSSTIPVLDQLNEVNVNGYVYLVRLYPKPRKLRVYRGFTVNLRRRMRQHNGIQRETSKRKGARTTRCDHTKFVWRPVLIVRGFRAKQKATTQALSFEWWIKKRKYQMHEEWKSKCIRSFKAENREPVLSSVELVLQRLHQLKWRHCELLWFRPELRPLTNPGQTLLPRGMKEYVVSPTAQQELFQTNPREMPWHILPYDPVP